MSALPSAAISALALLKQGPVEIMVDPGANQVQLFPEGGIEVNFSSGTEPANVDTLGIYDLYTTGDSADFSLVLPEMSLNILRVIFPSGFQGATYHGFGRTAGTSLRATAKRFRIRPWQQRELPEHAAILVQLDLWLVTAKGDAKLSQDKTKPYTYTVAFQALPDTTKEDGLLIARLKAPERA